MRYLVILISATMLGSSSAYEMIKALRTWKLPEPVVIMVSFTIQFLRQLQVDFRILYQNLLRRNISFRGRSLKGKLNLLSLLIIPVIGRLFSDIRYKVIAMELNGYGIKRTASSFFYKKCQPRDYLLMMFFLGILSLIWHIL
jgi:energy-coupling factor transporter transmembrane protein EcfT